MYVDVNGTRIFIEKRGVGYPLIFVHGNGEDHTIFNELIKKLESHFTCYLIDSRNHGKSLITDQYHYETMADDVNEVIKYLGLDKPIYLGFSDGGIIGLVASIKYHNLFSKMIICGTNIHPKGIIKNVRNAWRKVYEKSLDPLIKMMLEEPNLTWNDLHQIGTPTLVVAGEFDVISRRHTEAIHKHLKHSKLHIMKEKHHEDYVVHRDDLYEIVIDYLDKP